jgi:hypothetical protein
MNPLLWILQFAFGCHHGHLSRVFTIKKRTTTCALIVDTNSDCRMRILRHLPVLLILLEHG